MSRIISRESAIVIGVMYAFLLIAGIVRFAG